MMVTNFHLPKSSLLMLVSAFIGRERMMEIYQHAITQKYRFCLYFPSLIFGLALTPIKAISPPKPPPLIMQAVDSIKTFHRLLAKSINYEKKKKKRKKTW
jgi:hypothetical protein